MGVPNREISWLGRVPTKSKLIGVRVRMQNTWRKLIAPITRACSPRTRRQRRCAATASSRLAKNVTAPIMTARATTTAATARRAGYFQTRRGLRNVRLSTAAATKRRAQLRLRTPCVALRKARATRKKCAMALPSRALLTHTLRTARRVPMPMVTEARAGTTSAAIVTSNVSA